MPTLNKAEQQLLLSIARSALETGICSEPERRIELSVGPLTEPSGAFVTLRMGGHLRGCIGFVEPIKPLHVTVSECALAAALRDSRFKRVEPEEVLLLRLEISVLSPLEEIRPEQVIVGEHGLLVSRGFQRGLLLPQVAVEYGWDREEFLSETCLKAGLPADAWKRGATIQAFTAQVFHEEAIEPSSEFAA